MIVFLSAAARVPRSNSSDCNWRARNEALLPISFEAIALIPARNLALNPGRVLPHFGCFRHTCHCEIKTSRLGSRSLASPLCGFRYPHSRRARVLLCLRTSSFPDIRPSLRGRPLSGNGTGHGRSTLAIAARRTNRRGFRPTAFQTRSRDPDCTSPCGCRVTQ